VVVDCLEVAIEWLYRQGLEVVIECLEVVIECVEVVIEYFKVVIECLEVGTDCLAEFRGGYRLFRGGYREVIQCLEVVRGATSKHSITTSSKHSIPRLHNL